jgi:hypothetical protein
VILVRCGQDVLVDEGQRLVFGRQPGTGGNAMFFVGGLFGTILLTSGISVTATGGALGAGIGLVAIGATLVTLVVRTVRRRDRLRPTVPVVPLVVLDLAAGMLLDGRGRVLAPLSEALFEPRFQLTSSSRALACRWPTGEVEILRGDAFGGGIGPAIDALRGRGLRA